MSAPESTPTPSRRGLLIAGALTVAATAAGLRYATAPKAIVDPDDEPTSQPAVKLPPLAPLPDPTPFATFTALSTIGVMQDFSYLPDSHVFFVTQKENGSNGSPFPFETLVVNRVDETGRLLDAMVLIDGGHGIGIEAEAQQDGTYLWLTWLGKTADSGWRQSDFVRLRYTPGTWTRGQAVQQLALTVVAQADGIESQYRFDWKNGLAVERHYDFNDETETYKRRRISDLLNGVLLPDDRIELMRIPVNPPTLQGFATIDDTFYRWCGASTSDDVPVPGDPIMLQRWDWATGQLRAQQAFPNLSKGGSGWPDGKLEPEGAALYREADGSATLLVGDTTGIAPQHRHHVSAFARIAAR